METDKVQAKEDAEKERGRPINGKNNGMRAQ
jgi:hypothetical protein